MRRTKPKLDSISYRCSFCGKVQDQVARLIAGPGGVYICNECIDLCSEILVEERETKQQSAPPYALSDYAEMPTQTLLAPIASELAAARATIERLATENGALRERLRTLESS